MPRSTLQDQLNGTHGPTDGRRPILSEKEEKKIVKCALFMATWGFSFSAAELCRFIKDYLDERGRDSKFEDNLPSKRFIVRFMSRHKELSLRRANPIKRSRAKVSREQVTEFIKNWQKEIRGVPPTHIFNFDETNLQDDPGINKRFFKKGEKYCEFVQNTSKQAFSVMFCGTASGHMLPPMVLYKAKGIYPSWSTGGPRGTVWSFSKSGWFDADKFREFFNNLLLPYAQKLPGKKVAICDNLASHISVDVIESCRENNIAFVCLPPYSTDKLQPLDVGVFRLVL